jgi:hypothetical protein
MLAGFVPTSNNKDEAGADTALEETLQGSQGSQLLKVFG